MLFSDRDYQSREEALAAPFELPIRVWDGDGEGGAFELADSVPPLYLDSFARTEWVTEDVETGEPIHVQGDVKGVWAEDVPIFGSNGEKFNFGVTKESELYVWNDNVARALKVSFSIIFSYFVFVFVERKKSSIIVNIYQCSGCLLKKQHWKVCNCIALRWQRRLCKKTPSFISLKVFSTFRL